MTQPRFYGPLHLATQYSPKYWQVENLITGRTHPAQDGSDEALQTAAALDAYGRHVAAEVAEVGVVEMWARAR